MVLIYCNHSRLLVMPDGHPRWVFFQIRSHWGNHDRVEVPVHLARGDDNTRASFFYFAANGWVKIYQNNGVLFQLPFAKAFIFKYIINQEPVIIVSMHLFKGFFPVFLGLTQRP